MTVEFVTPVGRIVWGNPGRSTKKTDIRTKQPVLRDGKQVEQWSFGLAIPKNEFHQFVLPYLQQEAATVYPQGTPPNFTFKFKDGDGMDANGKPFSEREGYAGCYVLTVSTEAFAPPIFKNEGGRYRQMDASEVKTGDFVAVSIICKFNGATPPNTPGLYINPKGIEFVAYGQEIISSGANPDEMFGGRIYQLPPGASATPLAPAANTAPPYAAPQPQQPAAYQPPQQPAAYQPPQQPAAYQPPQQPAAYQPPQQPAAYPPPAHDLVRNAGQPQPMPQQYAGVPRGR